MTETFYRVHDAGTEFSTKNAWSSQAGVDRVAIDRYLCLACEGSGTDPNEADEDGSEVPCRDCGGEGSIQCERGYSCCWSAEDLIAYFGYQLGAGSGSTVVIFEGEQSGTGIDGEPLAVPSRVVRTLTWAEFTSEHAA